MNAGRFRPIVVPTLVIHLLFGFTSCSGSGASTSHTSKYDSLPFADTFQFQATQKLAYRAAVTALQDMGAVITLSDPQTGLINAEMSSIEAFEKSARDSAAATNENSGGGVMAFLGVIFGLLLFVLLLGWLAEGCSSTDSSSRPRHSPRPDPPAPEPVVAGRYMISLTMSHVGQATTDMRVLAMRQRIENGTVTETVRLQNKVLNYSIRDAVQGALDR